MRAVREKLHTRCGETLMETLVSILILTLSSLLLLAFTSAAASLDSSVATADAQYLGELAAAEANVGDPDVGADGAVQLSISGGTATQDTYDVVFVGGSGQLTSYAEEATP